MAAVVGEDEHEGGPPPQREYLHALARANGSTSTDDPWDRGVEARATGADAQAVRRAGLAHGWAARQATPPDLRTRAREGHMASAISRHLAAGRRVTAAIGAYHAPALLEAVHLDPATDLPFELVGEVRGALVGYGFAQLDSRSGYPAGIRDPLWQQLVVEAGRDPAAVTRAATEVITWVSRELRADGHPAGAGEAAEAVRVAADLAALRGLAAPARREVVEALTTVHAQGDVLGRGRAVAAAAHRVLVGDLRGAPAPGTPVSALRAHVLDELAAARLPTDHRATTLTLRPLGGGLDLTRHVLLRRMSVARIPYATAHESSTWRGADRVTTTWDVGHSAATDAGIELAAAGGLTLAQVVGTALRTRLVAIEAGATDELLRLCVDAADTGSDVTAEVVDRVVTQLPASAGFTTAVTAAAVLADIARARLPGAALLAQDVRERSARAHELLVDTAVRELDGLAGSQDPDDARGLASLVHLAAARELGVRAAVRRIAREGSALMQGAAAGILLSGDLGPVGSGAAVDVASWVDQASTPTGRRALRDRLTGLLAATGSRIESSDAFDALVRRVVEVSDDRFVEALPALRGGFDGLGGPQRAEVMAELGRRLGADLDAAPTSGEDVVAVTRHDQAARSRLAALGLADLAFAPAERWRLVLGRSAEPLSATGTRMAAALDELYGSEGSDGRPIGGVGAGGGGAGGDEPPQPAARRWSAGIRSLFGEDQVTEILGEAAAAGRTDVVAHLDPETIHPSAELLSTMLTLSGALPESRLRQVRPIVGRLVDELSAQLATRVRPALVGLDTPRRTRRRTGRLDLPGTIRANLRHVVRVDDRVHVVPATPVFTERGAREADWHVIVLVDVSGSMESSVLFSAMTAAILAGVRCLRVTFLAFSTEVVDLSDHVDDPLALLLEIQVGGGTDIAGALRVASSRVQVPTRTLLALVSDFGEGGSVPGLLAEVTRLRDSGVTMLGCAALDDSGQGVYNVGIAEQVSAAGMRVARVSPLDLARWVAQVVDP